MDKWGYLDQCIRYLVMTALTEFQQILPLSVSLAIALSHVRTNLGGTATA